MSIITGLTPAEIAALTTADIAGLTTTDIAEFTNAQIPALTSAQIQALSVGNIAAFSTVQFPAFTTGQIAASSALSLSRLGGYDHLLVTTAVNNIAGMQSVVTSTATSLASNATTVPEPPAANTRPATALGASMACDAPTCEDQAKEVPMRAATGASWAGWGFSGLDEHAVSANAITAPDPTHAERLSRPRTPCNALTVPPLPCRRGWSQLRPARPV